MSTPTHVRALVTLEPPAGPLPARPISVCPGHVRSQLVVHALAEGDDEAIVAVVAAGLREALRQLRGQPPASAASGHR